MEEQTDTRIKKKSLKNNTSYYVSDRGEEYAIPHSENTAHDIPCLCNVFKGKCRNDLYHYETGISCSGRYIRIKPDTTFNNDVPAFDAYLNSLDDPYVWYKLEPPIVTLGDPVTIATYPEYTTISVSGDYAPDITATAKIHD